MRKLLVVACVLLLALLALATVACATTAVRTQVADPQAITAHDFQAAQLTATRASPGHVGQQSAVIVSNSATIDQRGTADDHLWLRLHMIKGPTVASSLKGEIRGSPITDNVESTITPTTPNVQCTDIWQARQAAVAHTDAGTIAEQAQTMAFA